MNCPWRAVAVAACLCAGSAFGQSETPPQDDLEPGVGGSGPQQNSDVMGHGLATPERRPRTIWEAMPLTYTVQGGVEGYSGATANHINLGATYGVSVAYERLGFLGLEVGYSGATNSLSNVAQSTGNPLLFRNGGYAVGTSGIPFTLNARGTAGLKPYLLGGIGFDVYTPQNSASFAGYTSRTTGCVPFGAGLELRAGPFVADARFTYTWETGSPAIPYDNTTFRYQGQLFMGAAW